MLAVPMNGARRPQAPAATAGATPIKTTPRKASVSFDPTLPRTASEQSQQEPPPRKASTTLTTFAFPFQQPASEQEQAALPRKDSTLSTGSAGDSPLGRRASAQAMPKRSDSRNFSMSDPPWARRASAQPEPQAAPRRNSSRNYSMSDPPWARKASTQSQGSPPPADQGTPVSRKDSLSEFPMFKGAPPVQPKGPSPGTAVLQKPNAFPQNASKVSDAQPAPPAPVPCKFGDLLRRSSAQSAATANSWSHSTKAKAKEEGLPVYRIEDDDDYVEEVDDDRRRRQKEEEEEEQRIFVEDDDEEEEEEDDDDDEEAGDEEEAGLDEKDAKKKEEEKLQMEKAYVPDWVKTCVLEHEKFPKDPEDLDEKICWVVEAARQAPRCEGTKHFLRKLMAMQSFTSIFLKSKHLHKLRDELRKEMLALGEPLQFLPNQQGFSIGFSMDDLMHPDYRDRKLKASQSNLKDNAKPGMLPPLTTLPVFENAIGYPLEGDGKGFGLWLKEEKWDWDSPHKMHESVYIHVLGLIAHAINDSFHDRVEKLAKSTFGQNFGGCNRAPPKSYGRMAAKLISRDDHRMETVRPRPALNVDVVRILVVVKNMRDLEAFLVSCANEFGGFVKVKNKYTYTPEKLKEEFHLPLVLVSMIYDSGMTFDDLTKKHDWQKKYRDTKAYKQGQPQCRWNGHVDRAVQWMKMSANAKLPVRLICEVQVLTEEVFHCRHGMHELFKFYRPPDYESMWRDFKKKHPKPPTNLKGAATQGELNLVLKFLRDINEESRQEELNKALAGASRQGHADVAYMLLKEGANPNDAHWNRKHALAWAAAQGSIDVVRVLLEFKADVNQQSEEDSGTALIDASQGGHLDIVEVLLKAKADVRLAHDRGAGALIHAAGGNHVRVVELLLNSHAEVDQLNNDRDTPLMRAAKRGFVDCVDVLLARKAAVNARNNDKETPLFLAASEGRVACVTTLLENKGNVEMPDKMKRSPLYCAAKNGHTTVVELLLYSKADIEQKTTSGATALMAATISAHYDTVKTLLRHHAQVNAENDKGQTALSAAAKSTGREVNSRQCMRLLLEHQANPNDAERGANKAVDEALRRGDIDVRRLVNDACVDVEEN